MKITLNDTHAETIIRALDFYSRVAGMLQYTEIVNEKMWYDPRCQTDTKDPDIKLNNETRDLFESYLFSARMVICPHLGQLNGSYGISGTPKQYQVAYEILKEMEKYRSYWYNGKDPEKDERDWTKQMGVNYDGAMKISGEELVKIEKD